MPHFFFLLFNEGIKSCYMMIPELYRVFIHPIISWACLASASVPSSPGEFHTGWSPGCNEVVAVSAGEKCHEPAESALIKHPTRSWPR